MCSGHRLLLACLLTLLIACLGSANESQRVLLTDVREVNPQERLLCVSLQGVANRSQQGPKVFLITRDSDEEWLHIAQRLAPAELVPMSPPELLQALKSTLRGQVLYDPGAPFTLDLATTAAGLDDVVISQEDLGLPTIHDFRGRWQSPAQAYAWAIETLLPSCNQRRMALLRPDALCFRDYAIQQRMFTVSPPAWPDDDIFQALLFRLSPGAMIFGSAGEEIRAALSASSHSYVEADDAANLSFLSQIDNPWKPYQYVGYLETPAPRYLSLIFDCSELDFALTGMLGLWEDPWRGTTRLGWAIPGTLAETAPPVVHKYYADAYWWGFDQFVLGPSGAAEIDLARASSLHEFFRQTARVAAELDITAGVYASQADPASLGERVTRYAAETGMRGLFVMGETDFEPTVYGGVPAIAAPRVETVEEAITYLNRIPLERRCAALVLDPRYLEVRDAELIAAHVAGRYVVVPPGEMIEVLVGTSLAERNASGPVAITATDYGEPADPSKPIPVKAVIKPAASVLTASVIYRPAGSKLRFSEPMALLEDGSFGASVPPLREGGAMELQVKVRDGAGRETWSPLWTVTIPRRDTDEDGLSDAEEAFLLTDPEAPDTDGDGLKDSADAEPRRFGRTEIVYAGPVGPPNDTPYLYDPGGVAKAGRVRLLQPGQRCVYRVPLVGIAPRTPIVVELGGTGPASIAIGSDPSAATLTYEDMLEGTWYSEPVSSESAAEALFVRISCPEAASTPLRLTRLTLVSPLAAPSISQVRRLPPHPGPEQPIEISATVYSPRVVEQVLLTYRVNRKGFIRMPMELAGPHVYRARIPSFENRDELEYWVEATEAEGGRTVSQPSFALIGGRGREIVALVTTRDFIGEWSFGPGWEGTGRYATRAGAQDLAHVNVMGGTYTVWVLAAGGGRPFEVRVRNQVVGSIERDRPDGWQRIGRVRLDEGRHPVQVVAQSSPGGLEEGSAGYAGIVLSEDSSFEPPDNRVFDTYYALSLSRPTPGQTLSGQVELRGTGAGNITAAEFLLDGEVLRRVSGPPFQTSLNTGRLPEGIHVLSISAIYRGRPTGVVVEVPVMVAE